MTIQSEAHIKLCIDDAKVLNEKDPRAVIDTSVEVINQAEEFANVEEANLRFELHRDDGAKLTDLNVVSGSELTQIGEGERTKWQGRLEAKDCDLQPNKSYRLRVDAFGKTCTTRFEFL